MAALVLAEAAGVYDGKHVCQTQSYGPEARGGSSQADVVISSKEIDYPKAMKLDMLVAMNQAACDAHFSDLKPDGLLVVDSSLVEQAPTDRVGAIPFTSIARKEVGKEFVANMVALGAVAFLCREVSLKKMEAALSARVPPKTVDMNLKALRAGARAAKKVSLGALPRSVIREEIEL